MNGNTGLRLRTDFSKRAGGNRGAYRKGMNMQGLGGPPESILTTSDPVDMYIRAIQALISSVPEYHTVGTTPPSKTIVSNGIWDFATHNGVLDFVVSLAPTESSLANMPRWGENPALMAHFVIDLFLVGMEDSRIRESFAVFYETLGVPQAHEQTTDSIFQLFSLSRESEQRRIVGIMDKVMRYIIGAEGGVAYGSPAVQTEGIVAGALAFAGSVAGILLVG